MKKVLVVVFMLVMLAGCSCSSCQQTKTDSERHAPNLHDNSMDIPTTPLGSCGCKTS